MLVIFLMGFSSGIPLALTGTTLQAWMATEKIDLGIIGLFSYVGLPYTLKFLWSPLMDRYVPPFLGRRRGWILVTQVALIFAIIAMGFSNPTTHLAMIAILALLVSFFSASQDVVVDAYRTEILKTEEFGMGAGVATLGYRLAMLTSGAIALMMADLLPWSTVYLVMAGSLLVGVICNFFAEEPETQGKPKNLQEAFWLPLADFFGRKRAWEILTFITIYKLDVVVLYALMTPFLLEIGFTKTDIGAVFKIFGLVATLVGTLVGGIWMVKMGIEKALWVFGISQSLAGISFLILSYVGHNYPMFVTAITVENFCSGMGNAAYAAFIMSLCNKKFTATQFALLTSIMALTRVVFSSPMGYIAKAIGWENYFILSIVIAIPSLILLRRYKLWFPEGEAK
ncbi:MAG: AmpG family muropeptide MFS transporter [Deltaproteobacteria bacterium]|nr:AmpG family muropeptide MFS transporter [Deltaproteobacteria bacterium]